jgi:hypothetical protein
VGVQEANKKFKAKDEDEDKDERAESKFERSLKNSHWCRNNDVVVLNCEMSKVKAW